MKICSIFCVYKRTFQNPSFSCCQLSWSALYFKQKLLIQKLLISGCKMNAMEIPICKADIISQIVSARCSLLRDPADGLFAGSLFRPAPDTPDSWPHFQLWWCWHRPRRNGQEILQQRSRACPNSTIIQKEVVIWSTIHCKISSIWPAMYRQKSTT